MVRILLLLAVFFFASGTAGLAAPLQQDCSGVTITSPRESGDPVRGRVNISGSATLPNFQFYKVEAAAGNNPADTSFRNIAPDVHRSPVSSGLLDVWDTSGLADGPYTLRLTVVDIRGNFPCPPVQVRSIIVANRTLVATATPSVSATAALTTTTIAGTAVAPTGVATRAAAPTIALPTSAARSTITSTVPLTATSSNSRSLINLDFLPDLLGAVTWGVLGMMGVLGIAGIYIAVRWVFDHI